MNATSDAPPRAVGIDLGTTNCALAWGDGRKAIRVFDVPQLVAPGEIDHRPALPSFLYLPTRAEIAAGLVSEPWAAEPSAVAGEFAREHGALAPGRSVSSSKSWLANPSVDRSAAILPWGTDEGSRLSPVEASSRLLSHLREAWDHEFAAADVRLRLASQSIVLTVPASFDEEARELTLQAAKLAGLLQLRLLEEPLAALYAWIAKHRRAVKDLLGSGALVLVCDVGGGTSDFSLVRTFEEAGDLRFERIAIGEHLLLGGDNLDLALAARAEEKLIASGAPRLTVTQRQILRRKCTAAKERLLSSEQSGEERITILGAGRNVVAGGMTVRLTREEVVRTLTDGFLPITAPNDAPARDLRMGLRELGLPYEAEPAITKHLAAFLTRAPKGQDNTLAAPPGPLAKPDAVLFNGGFFLPPVARARVLDALESWLGHRPIELQNERPEAAVAIGAAFYARLRADPAAAERLLIRAGSARTYYVGVASSSAEGGKPRALAVMARGTQEGTSLTIDREFSVVANQPAAFTLFSSIDRTDPPGALVDLDGAVDVHRHAPLVTTFRYGKRSRRAALGVRLTVAFTETGTLELWCESAATEHRWRLTFDLRAEEAGPLDELEGTDASGDQVLIADARIEQASELIRHAFGRASVRPEALTGEIESALGHGKHAWPLPVIRKLADVLLSLESARRLAAPFEIRWLNLTGFCIRPGFGSPIDEWRVSELRKVYAAGLAFPKDIQCQVEWLVLWQRVGPGFTAGQQRELAQRVSGLLGLGQRRAPRINPQMEREAWRLLGSLERLDTPVRVKLGDDVLEKIRREPRNSAWLWTVSRLGARSPLYGPLSSVVPQAVAGRWIERLLAARSMTPETAAALVQIAAVTGDPARDLPEDVRQHLADRLRDAGFSEESLVPLFELTPRTSADTTRAFGESLPEGLRLEPAQPVA